MDRSVGPLNSEFHQVFDIGASNLVSESFIEYFNCGLRGNFAGLRTAYTISHGKNRSLSVSKVSVFIQGSTLIQSSV
jgi:hypothetical protein